MRVALFSDCYEPAINGVVTSIALQREALQALGCRVDLYCPTYPEASPEDPEIHRLWARPFPLHRREQVSLPLPPAVLRRALSTPYDLVHIQTPFTAGLMGMACALARGTPRVFHHHTLWEEYGDYLPIPRQVTGFLAVRLCRAMAQACHAVVAPSEQVRSRFAAQGVTRPIAVVPTGIRAAEFRGGTPRPEAQGKRVCLYIGRLAREKSVDTVVRAFRGISEEVPEAELWLVGDGPAREELESLVAELGLSSWCRFFGFVPRERLKDYVASAQLFLFASVTETQGLMVLEAQSGGVPVVAVRASGVDEAVRHGDGGVLVEPGDTAALARESVALLLDDELRTGYSKRARQWAEGFTIEAMGEGLLGLYRKVLNGTSNSA